MASSVEFEPLPATTGTRPLASSTHHSTTRLCSSCDSVGLSPVVPTGTKPLVPSAICQATRARKAFSSSAPSLLNGVTSAVNDPRKLVLAVMVLVLQSYQWRRRGTFCDWASLCGGTHCRAAFSLDTAFGLDIAGVQPSSTLLGCGQPRQSRGTAPISPWLVANGSQRG